MKLKKMLTGFMAICMVTTAVPMTAMAEEPVLEPASEESVVEDTNEDIDTVEELQAVIDAAEGEAEITIDGNIEGNITIKQKGGLHLTIDGGDNQFTGRMTIIGCGSDSNTSVTIKKVKFKTSGTDNLNPVISVPGGRLQYTNNIKVKECVFSNPDKVQNAVAIKQKTSGCKNWVIENCTVTDDMFSLLQVERVIGLTIKKCTVTSPYGAQIKNSDDVLFEGNIFNVNGYAVSAGNAKGGAYEDVDITFKGNKITSEGTAISVRNATLFVPVLSFEEGNVIDAEEFISGDVIKKDDGTNTWIGPIEEDVVKTTLKITEQPVADKDVPLGETATVSVTAVSEDETGNSYDELKYFWYFRDDVKNNFQASSIKTAEYSVALTEKRVNREIYCVIADAHGNKVETEKVRLVEYTDNFVEESGVKLTAELVCDDKAIGETATVSAIAEGDGLTYTWFYRDSAAKDFAKSTIKDSAYSVIMTAARADREIYCVITDAYGNTVTTNTVKLIKGADLVIINQPETDTTAKLGDTAKVTIEAAGDALTYTWYYRDYTKSYNDWTKSSIKSNVYSLTVKDSNAYRELYCVVTDAHGNSVISDVVKMIEIPELEITKQPQDESAAVGDSVSVFVKAEGYGLKYQWYYKNANQKNFTKSSITKDTYTITMKESLIDREVYCVIKNPLGAMVTTETVTLGMVKPDYFESLSDVFGGAIGSTEKTDNAVVAVVEEDGEKIVTLLDNVELTETLNINEDATLELNGHEITTTVNNAITINADVVIDGTAEDSAITVNAPAGKEGTVMNVNSGELTVNGGTYTSNTSGYGKYITTHSQVIKTAKNTTLNVNDATILANSEPGKKNGVVAGVYADGKAVLRDCTVIAAAEHYASGKTYASTSFAVYSTADLELYDCYVWGAHSGVAVKGSVYVDGGTYEGFGHGAFYLQGAGTTSYFYNATINWADMINGLYHDTTAGSNGSGFYIGGASNITAYFDNCTFNTKTGIYNNNTYPYYCIVLRNSSGEKNNNVFVSNSTFVNAKQYVIRTKTASNYFNSGVGNVKEVNASKWIDDSSKMNSTNESYAK